MDDVKVIQKRAIDVTPHNHALWCSIEGEKPFCNTIEWRDWDEDGRDIVFGLDTHNGFSAPPDKMIGVVEVKPGVSQLLLDEWMARDARQMATRPIPTVSCPHCSGTGKVINKGRIYETSFNQKLPNGDEVDVTVTFGGYYDPGNVCGPMDICYPPEGEVDIQSIAVEDSAAMDFDEWVKNNGLSEKDVETIEGRCMETIQESRYDDEA